MRRLFPLLLSATLGCSYLIRPSPLRLPPSTPTLETAIAQLDRAERQVQDAGPQAFSGAQYDSLLAIADGSLAAAHVDSAWTRPHPLEQAWLHYYLGTFACYQGMREQLRPTALADSLPVAARKDSVWAACAHAVRDHYSAVFEIQPQLESDDSAQPPVPWAARFRTMDALLYYVEDGYVLPRIVATRYSRDADKLLLAPRHQRVLEAALFQSLEARVLVRPLGAPTMRLPDAALGGTVYRGALARIYEEEYGQPAPVDVLDALMGRHETLLAPALAEGEARSLRTQLHRRRQIHSP